MLCRINQTIREHSPGDLAIRRLFCQAHFLLKGLCLSVKRFRCRFDRAFAYSDHSLTQKKRPWQRGTLKRPGSPKPYKALNPKRSFPSGDPLIRLVVLLNASENFIES